MEEPEWVGSAGLLRRRFISRWSKASLSKLAAEDLREPGTEVAREVGGERIGASPREVRNGDDGWSRVDGREDGGLCESSSG